jgi:hypothetical protein
VRRSEEAGAQAIFDTGNWIDGYAKFNAHDLEAHGFEEQCELLASRHPRTSLRSAPSPATITKAGSRSARA